MFGCLCRDEGTFHSWIPIKEISGKLDFTSLRVGRYWYNPVFIALSLNWYIVPLAINSEIMPGRTTLKVCESSSFIYSYGIAESKVQFVWILWCNVFLSATYVMLVDVMPPSCSLFLFSPNSTGQGSTYLLSEKLGVCELIINSTKEWWQDL